jgi:hypothetical protein
MKNPWNLYSKGVKILLKHIDVTVTFLWFKSQAQKNSTYVWLVETVGVEPTSKDIGT